MTWRRFASFALTALLVARGAAAATTEEDAPATGPAGDPFPVPARVAEAVDFWRRVWSAWSVSQAVVHDSVHLDVVYAIVEIPGPDGDAYTDDQRAFVARLRNEFASRLAEIERRLAAGEPLDDGQKALALAVVTGAGGDAVRGAAMRVRVQRGLKERFLHGVSISTRYLPEFRRIFREAGLPEDLAYLPHVESSFRADARSSAGAVGMWQFTRAAGRMFLTIHAAIDERLDPVAAARGAARYLRRAHAELGSWPLALTSYNHGIAGMRRARQAFGDDFEAIVAHYDGSAFGFASRNFYASFIAARDVARVVETAPPEGLVLDPALDLDRTVLSRPTRAIALARAFGVELGELASINPGWTRRAVRGNAALPAGTTVWLPPGTLARASGGRANVNAAGDPGLAVPGRDGEPP